MKKLLSIFLAVAMIFAMVAVSASADGAKITFLNTKQEVQDYLEELGKAFFDETGITVEFYTNTEENHINEKYAAGAPYTITMMDHPDVADYQEYLLPLNDEEWAAFGGNEYGMTIDGNLYGFPFCIEAVGMIYNAKAIEDITGEEFDPAAYTTLEAFEGLLEKLVEGGMETPVAVNKDDWSLASHLFGQFYCFREDGTEEPCLAFADELKAGTVNLAEDAAFNAAMDTIDVLLKYNINRDDPLSASYDMNNVYLNDGDVAFWPNGSWATNLYEYTDKIGIMPLPMSGVEEVLTTDLICGASKMLVIDKAYSTEEEQEAARTFLNWLVNSDAGKDFLVNKSSLIVAFSNMNMDGSAPLSASAFNYIKNNMWTYWYQEMPSDHNTEVGALLQKYISNNIDRTGLAAELEAYWKVR